MRPSRPPGPNRQPPPPRDRSRRSVFRDPSIEGVRSTGEIVEGTVAWFDADKGFGFVDLGGDRQAFLHASALEARRLRPPQQGAKLRGRIGEGPKGLQVTEVVSLTAGDVVAEAGDRRPPAARPAPGVPMLGIVKRFDAEKGFGFVGVDDGGGDVFLHVSAVKRTGMETPVAGQRVMILVAEGPRGREARSIAPVD